jgi:integral membrane protein
MGTVGIVSDPSPLAFGSAGPAPVDPTSVDPAPARRTDQARQRRHRAASTNIPPIRCRRSRAGAAPTAFLTLITVGIINATTGWGDWALFVMGNVHGAIFTTYLVSITIFHRRVGWGPLMLLLVLLAGFVPGGGLMVERWALSAPGREE